MNSRAGCCWADYLNSPPAEPLGIRYPKWRRPSVLHEARVAALGFDPITDPATRSSVQPTVLG